MELAAMLASLESHQGLPAHAAKTACRKMSSEYDEQLYVRLFTDMLQLQEDKSPLPQKQTPQC